MKFFIPSAYATGHNEFQSMVLVGAKHPQVCNSHCREIPEDGCTELEPVAQRLKRLILRGQMRWKIFIPWIDRTHQPVALHHIAFPLDP